MNVFYDDDRESVGLYKRLVAYEVSEDEGLRLIETKGFTMTSDTNREDE